MSDSTEKLLVVQVAGLGWDLLQENDIASLAGLPFHPVETVFPALTCPVQASFRTAAPPGDHGMVANGRYFSELQKVMFWEQAAGLVDGARVWSPLREAGGRVAMLFWQQSLGESVDMLLSPAPIHKHHGGIIPSCYSQPPGLFEKLAGTVGRPFKLEQYWGPMASAHSSEWIAAATVRVISDPDLSPDLCFTYLPGLDYDLQRYGPHAPRSVQALAVVRRQLESLVSAARDRGYGVVVFGDYAIADCQKGPVFPNRALADAGLLASRDVKGMRYLDLHRSQAFAVVDHEIAHVHVSNPAAISQVQAVLSELPGVESVAGRAEQAELSVNHSNSGELLLVAGDGHWFAYPWWSSRSHAPDFAGHVDIHSKPGYDPCELFWGWPPGSVSQDAKRIRGSHGRVGPGRRVACAWTLGSDCPESLLDVSQAVATWSRGFRGDT